MIYCWLTYNFVNLVSASKIPSGNFTSLFPRTLLSFKKTKNSFILKQGVYFTALVWWAETTKTVKSREEKNHFLSSLLSRLTLSSQSYLPFSSNKISHATEKCSIVKTISIITCWRSLPEPFVIFPCSGLRLFKALVNIKKNHRENLDSVLSTAPNQSNPFSFAQMKEQISVSMYIYSVIWIELGKKRDYDTYISLLTVLWDFRD